MDYNKSARVISITIQILPIITSVILIVSICACCLCLMARRLHRPTLTRQNALVIAATRGSGQTVIVPPGALIQPMMMEPPTRINNFITIDEDLPPPYEMVVSKSDIVKPILNNHQPDFILNM